MFCIRHTDRQISVSQFSLQNVYLRNVGYILQHGDREAKHWIADGLDHEKYRHIE